jgi:hypothetical protein
VEPQVIAVGKFGLVVRKTKQISYSVARRESEILWKVDIGIYVMKISYISFSTSSDYIQ